MSTDIFSNRWSITDGRFRMVDFGPEVRVTDELIADPPVSEITGQDLIRVTEAAPGGRSLVVFTDDYGGRADYVLTDHDPVSSTFGLRRVR